MWARCWQTCDSGARFPSPRVDWPQIGGWGLLRRAGAAETGDGGCGCLDSGKDRDGAAQRVARLASLRPSGGHGRVGWPGERVGIELTGGCSAAAAGTRAPARGQRGRGNKQARKLQGGLEQGLGACLGSESRWKEELGSGPSMAHGGARLGVRRQRARLASFGP
jgi:hypothetical protein